MVWVAVPQAEDTAGAMIWRSEAVSQEEGLEEGALEDWAAQGETRGQAARVGYVGRSLKTKALV